MKIKIGELAKMADCPVVTIRFYEKEGLLTAPERSGGNYRLYDDKDIERLRFIKHCRGHGMKLSEIRELLAFKDNPTADCGWINSLVEAHISNVTEQINSLTLLKKHLQNLLHKCSGDKKADCGILEGLSSPHNCPYCEDLRCLLAKGPTK
jgi:Cd(II)/Pb(II)-responsive transcriptional regulator